MIAIVMASPTAIIAYLRRKATIVIVHSARTLPYASRGSNPSWLMEPDLSFDRDLTGYDRFLRTHVFRSELANGVASAW